MRSISLHLLGGTQYGKGQKGAGYPYIIYSWILHTTHLQIEFHMPCMWQFRNCIQYPARINWTKIVALKPCWRFTCRCWWTLSRQRLRLSPLQGHGGKLALLGTTLYAHLLEAYPKKMFPISCCWRMALCTSDLCNSNQLGPKTSLSSPWKLDANHFYSLTLTTTDVAHLFVQKRNKSQRERRDTHTHTLRLEFYALWVPCMTGYQFLHGHVNLKGPWACELQSTVE